MSEVLEAIWREHRGAREQMRPVVHIRVTRDALPGSVVAVPLTPERARTLGRLRLLPGGAVVSDLENERLLELLVHPEDWGHLLTQPDAHNAIQRGEVTSVFGIPVDRV